MLLSVGFSAQAKSATADTVFWHISYDKKPILDGNLNAAQPARYELTLKPGSVDDLTVSFMFTVQPKTSSLLVKEKNEVLRVIDQDPVMGSYFVVPVRELISTHQSDVRYEVDFYYTNDRGLKERKLATIIFIFK